MSEMAQAFVACVLRKAGMSELKAPIKAPIRPAYVVSQGPDFVAYSGGAYSQFEEMEDQLTQWLGAPKVEENRERDFLIGRRAEFPGGTSLVFLSERNGGISFYVPQSALSVLAGHVAAAQQQPEGRGGLSL